MIELAILLRTLNLYSHHAHNLCKGCEFFQDHDFFAELYAFAEESYDSVIERQIGTKTDEIDLVLILKESVEILSSMNSDYFKNCLITLDETIRFIDNLSKNGNLSGGTVNMLQGISDSMEVFIYKIKRRVK